MKYVVNAEEMRSLEQNAIRRIGISEEVLMERAAYALWQELEKRSAPGEAVCFLCGTGNNGGDGLAAARMAYLGGRRVSVGIVSKDGVRTFELASQGETVGSGDAAGQENISASAGFAGQFSILSKICKFVGKDLDLAEYTIVVDAVFGIGLSRPVAGTYRDCLLRLQQEKLRRRLTVISVDIPSGVSADTGRVMGIAPEADLTVTFGWEKMGLLLYPGARYAGEVVTADIGIPPEASLLGGNVFRRMEPRDILSLPKRDPDTHKGDYGKITVIAGSDGMCGAAMLAAKAAYRAGAGIVAVVSAEENRVSVQTALPEAIFAPRRRAKERIDWADCLAIGPGLGTDEEAAELVRLALASGKPVVVDADALNCISKSRTKENPDGDAFGPDLPEKAGKDPLPEEAKKNGSFYDLLHDRVIVTPHIGEMARLTGLSVAEVREKPVKAAREFAAAYGCICVLKGARTIISDGRSFHLINTSGNAGMAAGGSGDVLTGILGGLLATERDVRKAAALGVYVHGLAGDRAAEKLGERSMTAADLLEGIPQALRG